MFRRLMITVLALLFALGLVACGEQRRDPAQGGGGKLEAVATYSILGDIVKNVGGDNVELTTLVDPNGDAHTFEPTPADGAKLSEADVIFENGLEFETWLDDIYESSDSEAERVAVTDDIEPLSFSGEGHDHEGEEEHSHEGENHDHADETSGEASEEESGSSEPEEVSEISLRLLVTDGEEGKLSVVDTGGGEVMDTYPVESPARVYSGEDGVHGYAVQAESNVMNVVESGFTVEAHGDHDHLYEADPSMMESTIRGGEPVHFVAHDGQVAIFNDGDGTAEIFDEANLDGGDRDATTIQTGEPHHGVAVPMEDRVIATVPNREDPEELPNGLNVYDMDGEVVREIPGCGLIHGEASIDDTVAFACDDGIQIVERSGSEFTSEKIPYPEDRGEEDRAYTVLADEELPYMLGDFNEDTLLYIDPESGESREIPLPEDAGEFALSPEHGALVITTDGTLHAIDPTTGEATGSVEVAEPFSLEGDFTIPRPAVSEAGEVAYVSDPATGSVHQVDLEGMEVSDTYEVGGIPGGLTTLGPIEYASTAHSHEEEDHEEHSHEGDENSHEHADGEGGHSEEGHGEEHADEEHGEEGHSHEHGEFDPHVWFDVGNAEMMVGSVRDALVEADPENAESYEQNAEEYLTELSELDSWVGEQTANVPEENRRLVTSHDTFGYFAEAYGYEVAGTGLSSFSTEASDPSAGETAELVEEIESSGVPAIFTENVSNPALMEQVASESEVEVAPPLYTDALGEEGSEGDTYAEMMRYDVRIITEALGGG